MPGSGNVLKMIQSLFFADSEHLGNLPQIETCVAQGYGNFLPQRERLLCEGIHPAGVFSSHDGLYSTGLPEGVQLEDSLGKGCLVMIFIIAFLGRVRENFYVWKYFYLGNPENGRVGWFCPVFLHCDNLIRGSSFLPLPLVLASG